MIWRVLLGEGYMSSMSPDMYKGEHRKNEEALEIAKSLRKDMAPDGQVYLVRSIEDKLRDYNAVITKIDSRIKATEDDIKGLLKDSKRVEHYQCDLKNLEEEKIKLESKRERLQKRDWTQPIKYDDEE